MSQRQPSQRQPSQRQPSQRQPSQRQAGQRRYATPEGALKSKIREFVNTAAVRVYDNVVGTFKTLHGDRIVRIGLTGSPDLWGLIRLKPRCHVCGAEQPEITRPIGFEVKTESGRLREDQARWWEIARRWHFLGGLTRSIEDAREHIHRAQNS